MDFFQPKTIFFDSLFAFEATNSVDFIHYLTKWSNFIKLFQVWGQIQTNVIKEFKFDQIQQSNLKFKMSKFAWIRPSLVGRSLWQSDSQNNGNVFFSIDNVHQIYWKIVLYVNQVKQTKNKPYKENKYLNFNHEKLF